MTTFLEHDWFPRPLPDNVTIGERSWVYSSYAFLHFRSERATGVEIGHDTGVYDGSFFELGSGGRVRIGNFCSIVGAIISTDADVTIGNHTFIAHRVVISDRPFASPPTEEVDAMPAPIHIGNNTWVGAHAIVLGGTTIGEGSVVGAGAVVDSDVPPFSLIAGNPAAIVRRLKR
jgi:acetyltransferase-like isoleucine patch superfamily enzyme